MGVREPQVRPEGIVSDIVIVPEKPLSAVTVIVDFPDDPVEIAVGEEALMVKSRKLKVDVVEWLSDPLVPVIVSV